MRPLQAECHRGRGELHRRRGRHKEAAADLTAAISLFRETGMATPLAETSATLREMERATG